MAILYSEEAIENLDDIYAYFAIERENPDDALRLLRELDDAINQLDIFPLMGVARERWKQGLRALIHDVYVITYIYEEADNNVVIMNVLDGRQDLESRYRDQ